MAPLPLAQLPGWPGRGQYNFGCLPGILSWQHVCPVPCLATFFLVLAFSNVFFVLFYHAMTNIWILACKLASYSQARGNRKNQCIGDGVWSIAVTQGLLLQEGESWNPNNTLSTTWQDYYYCQWKNLSILLKRMPNQKGWDDQWHSLSVLEDLLKKHTGIQWLLAINKF